MKGFWFGFSLKADIDEDDQQGGETFPRSDHEKPCYSQIAALAEVMQDTGEMFESRWRFTARLKNDGRSNEFSHHVLPLPLIMPPPSTLKF
ncbi:hypothetical protein HRI_003813100 [Hibiscus trionum]|uniref:Uncharacterized protein n=1 Tax=Hibiscus trionum TaxID=183268 RepID=A0A9W7IWX7_HIBTR|nr:hypothetical protein HRI_003813100 [Hibiscus trionum]